MDFSLCAGRPTRETELFQPSLRRQSVTHGLMDLGASSPEPRLYQILADGHPVWRLPARDFDVGKNESANVVEGPEDAGASRSVGAYPDGSEDKCHARPQSAAGIIAQNFELRSVK
jgi:hypothetical protein